MKIRPSNLPLCLTLLGLALPVLGASAFAQTRATLGVQIVGGYARLSIAGDVGSAWTVQYTSALGPSPAWQTLTNLTLSTSPTVVTDSTAPVAGRRFYRAVSQQTGVRLAIQVSGGYAWLSLTGPLGTSWTVLYTANLGSEGAWQSLTNVTLLTSPTVVADATGPVRGSRFYQAAAVQIPTNLVTTNMVWMPAGTFIMGSPTTEVGRGTDETQHMVTLTQGFFIGKYLVTQGDYLAVTGSNPSWFNGDRVENGVTNHYGLNLSRPVEKVHWYAAANYCALLTQNERLAGRLPSSWAYRLPTEAEWEYACRAGTTNRFSYGDDPTYASLANYAWYASNSSNVTHSVGQKLPNPAGLYDVHGDVYEWCQDWYGDYPTGPVVNPQGPDSGFSSVFRGGSYFYAGQYCRSAKRNGISPTETYPYLGFRIVLAPVQ